VVKVVKIIKAVKVVKVPKAAKVVGVEGGEGGGVGGNVCNTTWCSDSNARGGDCFRDDDLEMLRKTSKLQ
jgi:hypothetical protein